MRMLVIFGLLIASSAASNHVHKALETEMFAIPISPNLFNWTYQEFDQQYRFHASLVGRPELPSWLRYIYSGRHHSGFIFGTPPRGVKSPITLEVIGLNRQDYETRRLVLTLKIYEKENTARHQVELKIDNLNVEDLLDDHRLTSVKEAISKKLWTNSENDLYPTFLASAIDLGARLPLKPSDGEGVVVRFGSSQPFSEELKRLREEVRPLSKLTNCPRELKRTTMERIFRDVGLTLDWCNFELYNTFYDGRKTTHLEYLSDAPNSINTVSISNSLHSNDKWTAPSKDSLPSRSYTKQLIMTITVPVLLMLLSLAALTGVLCFRYAAINNREPENFFDDIFHICLDYKNRSAHKSTNIEICRYGTGNTDESQVADNTSSRSLGVSPNNSLNRSYSPKSVTNLAANYNRPQPPPYMGSATNTVHHRKSTHIDRITPSTSGNTPEHNRNHLVLEESLKLLNEAKLNTLDDLNGPNTKGPMIDLCDGSDDYIPIKATDYLNGDLEDIDVPELSMFGVSGVIGNI